MKVVITPALASQVSCLHNQCPKNKEWSGLLIAQITKGGINNLEEMEVTAEAVFPMDFGDATFTSFDGSAKFIDVFDQFPQVDPIKREANSQWFIGKIHSHHSMNSFHSGTDTTDLYENAPKLPFFLSLVVNYDCQPFAEIAIIGETEEKVMSKTKWKLRDFTHSGKEQKIEIKKTPTCLVTPCDVVYRQDSWFVKEVQEIKKKPASFPTAVTPGYYGGYQPKKEQGTLGFKQNVSPSGSSVGGVEGAVYPPNKVYNCIMDNLTNLVTLGEGKNMGPYWAVQEVSGIVTAAVKPDYIKAFKYYFQDWYEDNFYDESATKLCVLDAVNKFLSYHPNDWMFIVIKEAVDELKGEYQVIR